MLTVSLTKEQIAILVQLMNQVSGLENARVLLPINDAFQAFAGGPRRERKGRGDVRPGERRGGGRGEKGAATRDRKADAMNKLELEAIISAAAPILKNHVADEIMRAVAAYLEAAAADRDELVARILELEARPAPLAGRDGIDGSDGREGRGNEGFRRGEG